VRSARIIWRRGCESERGVTVIRRIHRGQNPPRSGRTKPGRTGPLVLPQDALQRHHLKSGGCVTVVDRNVLVEQDRVVRTASRAPALSALVGASSGAMGSPVHLGEKEKETSGT
jgi:hypothetical protein